MQPSLRFGLLSTALLLLALAPQAASAADHSLGVGVNFWRTIDGLPGSSDLDDIEDDGYAYVLSYQYRPRGIFTFQVDAEYFPDGYAGSTEEAIAPQAFIIVGRSFYGGVGAGVTYSKGLDDELTDPFYMGRVGWNLGLLGSISVDIHATYRFDEWEQLEEIDLETDSFTLGATARF